MENDEVIIERFLDAMWMERGLSENTLMSYRNDLKKLENWLEEQGLNLERVSTDDLQRYQQWLLMRITSRLPVPVWHRPSALVPVPEPGKAP